MASGGPAMRQRGLASGASGAGVARGARRTAGREPERIEGPPLRHHRRVPVAELPELHLAAVRRQEIVEPLVILRRHLEERHQPAIAAARRLQAPPYELAEAFQSLIDAGEIVYGVEIGPTRDLTNPLDLVQENFPYLRGS